MCEACMKMCIYIHIYKHVTIRVWSVSVNIRIYEHLCMYMWVYNVYTSHIHIHTDIYVYVKCIMTMLQYRILSIKLSLDNYVIPHK